MTMDIFSFINDLESKNIYREIASHRDDFIMVKVSVPGERWEIEFSKNGDIEVEIFKSDGNIFDESILKDLFSKFSD